MKQEVEGGIRCFKVSGANTLEWTSRWGKALHFPSRDVRFVNLNIKSDGQWDLSVERVNVFMNSTDSIKTCPRLQGTPYSGVEHTSLRPPQDVKSYFFCDAALPVKKMLDHVEHIFSAEIT